MPDNQDLMTTVSATPVQMFRDKLLPDALFAHIEKTIAEHVPDLTTDKGRKAIASLAYKVAQTKTAVDDAGKALNEDHRKAINAVDAERRTFRSKLEELQDKARKPLDDWQRAEDKRVEEIDEMLAMLREGAIVTRDETAAVVLERLTNIGSITFDPAVFQGMLPAVELEQKRAVETLTTIHASLVKAGADAAELERLKREEAERLERQRRDEDEARAAAAKREAEARALEQQERAAEEAREAERRKGAQAAAAADAAHQAELAAAQRRADEAEAAAKKAEDDRLAEEKRIADEAAARAADQKHRERAIESARDDIMSLLPSLSAGQALRIVEGIVRGEVSRVKLEF